MRFGVLGFLQIPGTDHFEETGIWDSLLQASYSWKELYKTASKVTATLRQAATPGAARDAGHYSRWARRRPLP